MPRIRPLTTGEFDAALTVINEAAESYRGRIPAERSLDPYMPREELAGELAAGVTFWACADGDELLGVMGIQDVGDVVLIRHAYVRPQDQGGGIGSRLLGHLLARAGKPVLIGTWAGIARTIAFYERHGFRLAPAALVLPLLEKFWQVPAAQAAASVVLANVSDDGLRDLL